MLREPASSMSLQLRVTTQRINDPSSPSSVLIRPVSAGVLARWSVREKQDGSYQVYFFLFSSMKKFRMKGFSSGKCQKS